MKESPFYQQIKAEGRDEGLKEARRADTLGVLEERFGAEAAAQVAEAVNALDDLERLERLPRSAARCSSVAEFQAGLSAATTPQPARRRRAAPRRRPSQ